MSSTNGNLYVLLLSWLYGRCRVLDAGVIGSGTGGGEGYRRSGRNGMCCQSGGTGPTGEGIPSGAQSGSGEGG